MKHPTKHTKINKGLLLTLIALFLTLAILSGTRDETGRDGAAAATPELQENPVQAYLTTQTTPNFLFTCPDGRIGLHIVHTRFLVSQAKSNLLFQASRLQLLHTFLIPCLRSQTNKKFILYVSYDPELKFSVVTAMHAALNLTGAYVIASPERDTSMMLTYSQIAEKLGNIDRRVNNIDLFITSRLDLDDITHVGSVEAIQNFACSGKKAAAEGAVTNNEAGAMSSSKMQGMTDDIPPVRVAYIQGGQLWFPSKKGNRPYGDVGKCKTIFFRSKNNDCLNISIYFKIYLFPGIWKTWREGVYDDIYKFLAIMQSMILSGQEFIRKCQELNVYSYPHYRPELLANISTPGCPKFEFKPDIKRSNRYMLLWDPPPGHIGNLYVRTTSSWTHKKIDLHFKLEAANISALQISFGISPAELSGANLLFVGFAEQRNAAAKLLINNSDVPIE